jgi:hypothetical protein
MASFILTFGETGHRNEKCIACGTVTVLVTAAGWRTHPPENDGESEDIVEPNGEVSGHYCPTCNALTAVFVHTRA